MQNYHVIIYLYSYNNYIIIIITLIIKVIILIIIRRRKVTIIDIKRLWKKCMKNFIYKITETEQSALVIKPFPDKTKCIFDLKVKPNVSLI